MAMTDSGKGPGILDDPEAVLDESFGKSEEFVKRNKKIITAVIVIVVLAVAGYFTYNYYTSKDNAEAQAEMFGAVYYFEADSLSKALKGNGKDLGFEEIAETYPRTKAGNLANFYVGVIYLKQGKFDDAIESLKKFSSDDLLLQARAYCLIGDANLEQKDLEGAIDYYKKAASTFEEDQTSAVEALFLAGYLADKVLNDKTQAVELYKEIKTKYPNALTQWVSEADKYLAAHGVYDTE